MDALNPKPPPEEGMGNLFPFPASFLLCQGSEGRGRVSARASGNTPSATKGPLDDIQQRDEKFDCFFWLSLNSQARKGPESPKLRPAATFPVYQLRSPLQSTVLAAEREEIWGPGLRELICPCRGQTHLGSAVQDSPGHGLASLNCGLATPLSPGHSAAKS